MRSLVLLTALAATLAGCASPSAGPATSTPVVPTPDAGPTVHSVQTIEGNFFDPVTLTVKAGATVTWDIVGEGHHTVDMLQPIDAEGTTPKSGNIAPGETFEITFPEPGSYKYYCKYHSNKQSGMMGTIIVE